MQTLRQDIVPQAEEDVCCLCLPSC